MPVFGWPKENAAQRRSRDRRSLLADNFQSTQKVLRTSMSELAALKQQQTQLLEEVEKFKIMVHYALNSVMAINWDNGMNMMQVSRKVESKLDEGLQHFQRMQRTLDSMEHDVKTSTAKVESAKRKVPCRFFAQGRCDRETCKFSHDFTPDKICQVKRQEAERLGTAFRGTPKAR